MRLTGSLQLSRCEVLAVALAAAVDDMPLAGRAIARVQAPSGGRSSEVTNDAVPKLDQEAVAAGSADIDAVSGATYTSGGYKQSLQSALDKAGG